MTPEQLLKCITLQCYYSWDEDSVTPLFHEGNIDDLMADWIAVDPDGISEALYSIREGEVETDFHTPLSRHYETKAVGAQYQGEWVGWTYWYGGGKHGDPDSIDLEPYALNCVEKEELVIVRRFSKGK